MPAILPILQQKYDKSLQVKLRSLNSTDYIHKINSDYWNMKIPSSWHDNITYLWHILLQLYTLGEMGGIRNMERQHPLLQQYGSRSLPVGQLAKAWS